jgi:hypothetical protein
MRVTRPGTHRGQFVDGDPTESFEIVEFWGQLDAFELRRQLGVSEDPAGRVGTS